MHTHPSYGMIGFTRVTTNGNDNFFGSELPQSNYIEMVVKSAEVERDLTNDFYYGKSLLLKLRITSTQFSELITSMNRHDGVPCTLQYVNNQHIEQEGKIESKKEFTHRKFKERMSKFSQSLKSTQNKAVELVKKKTLSKDDQHDLLSAINFLTAELNNNIPFFMECFQETMDKVVLEAKTEVENAIMHKITVLGLEKLQEQNNLLSAGK